MNYYKICRKTQFSLKLLLKGLWSRYWLTLIFPSKDGKKYEAAINLCLTVEVTFLGILQRKYKCLNHFFSNSPKPYTLRNDKHFFVSVYLLKKYLIVSYVKSLYKTDIIDLLLLEYANENGLNNFIFL